MSIEFANSLEDNKNWTSTNDSTTDSVDRGAVEEAHDQKNLSTHKTVTKFWPVSATGNSSRESTFWRKIKFIGRTDHHWYVRLPLWAQSTILITTIGFLSLFILLVVCAVQVWSYSLELMRARLATTAGMLAISLEQQFSVVSQDVSSMVSRPSVISFIEAANAAKLTPPLWYRMEQELNVQVFLSRNILGAQFYDGQLNRIYSYTQRNSDSARIGQQSSLLPQQFYPLSDSGTRNDTLAFLANGYPAVMGNATISTNNDTSVFLTFSLTVGITDSPIYTELGNVPLSQDSELIGYVTVIYDMPVTISTSESSTFTNIWGNAVREQDIFNTTDNQSFEFLLASPVVLAINAGPMNISDFPAIWPAYNLATTGSTNPKSKPNTSHAESDPLSISQQKAALDQILQKRGVKRSSLTNTSSPFGNSSQNDASGGLAGNSSISSVQNSTSINGTATNSTNATEPFKGDRPSFVPRSTGTVGKMTGADMRTSSPSNRKASVGFSYANILADQWLVFVEIPEAEAFTAARQVRNKVIGAAVGILGAVLIMVVPLSMWHTRGFYVVYQNMKLRPMFIIEEVDDEDKDSTSHTDENASLQEQEEVKRRPTRDPSPGANEDYSGRRHSHKEPVGEHLNASKETFETPFETNEESTNSPPKPYRKSPHSRNASKSHEQEIINYHNESTVARYDTEEMLAEPITPRASTVVSRDRRLPVSALSSREQTPDIEGVGSLRYTVPLPLPKLHRWFTDETDDLIAAYNNMVDRLNGQYLHLEDQVKSRTKEAQKATELREEANAAKSEFIAIITHELRTPLNGIMGLTAVSADEEDIEKVRGALRLIIESGHVLMGLLNELLELSKSLVGVDPIVSIFTPTTLMETLSDLFVSRMNALSVTFALAAVPQQLSTINMRGDMDHIAQICLSFMSNAMKFSADGGNVSVIMHLRPLDDPFINLEPYSGALSSANGVLEILVTDSGVGISPQQLARMFDLFVQGDDPLRKNHKGAGLGMALSKHLSEDIGGYVSVFSAKLVGSTVVLRVPIEVLDCSEEMMQSMYGPPIEFKVRNVFTTMSLHSGDVHMVPWGGYVSRTNSTVGDNHQRTGSKSSIFSAPLTRRSKHSHQISNGSKMLLTRTYPVAKLLTAHTLGNNASNHEHNKSEASHRTLYSQGSGKYAMHGGIHSSSDSSCLDNSTRTGSFSHQQPLQAISGSNPNKSASSLLLNLPDDLFSAGSSPTQRTSVLSVNSEDDLDKSVSPPSPHRPARLMIPPRDSSIQPPYFEDVSLPTAPNSAASDKHTAFYISPPHTTEQSPNDVSFSYDMRVLLAEDNVLNRSIMVKILNQIGISDIDIAADGDTVIKLVEKSIVGGYHYGMIFMDLSMPGKDGIEATNHIRGTLGYPYPIVALTGFTDLETRNNCLRANIQEVLTKPVMKHDIIRVLQSSSDFV